MAVVRTLHDNKYDRQMRLWGGHGQMRLETAHILVLGSGPTASECLKNLVLPNVGEFTLVDDAVVSESDLGNNFFVDDDHVGQPRAKVVCEMLLEMNPDVKGNFIVKSAADFLKDPKVLDKFRLVVATNLTEGLNRHIAQYLYPKNVPLVVLRSYGLLGYVRFQIAEHFVTESHYDNDRYDLCLHPDQLKQFPEYLNWINSFNIAGITDTKEHAHIPYVVILGQAIQAWVAKHGKVPTTFEETTAFKQSIKESARNYHEELNFQEAVQFAHRAYNKFQLDSKSQSVLDDSKANNNNENLTGEWILARAVNRFIRNEGQGNLPLSRAIPDMTSETHNYVELKRLFNERANKDEAAVLAHVQAILKELGRPANSINNEQVEYFVRNVRGIRVVRTGQVEGEYHASSFPTEYFNEVLEEYSELPPGQPKAAHWYFALRAADVFHQKVGRYPGEGEFDVDSDSATLLDIQADLFKQYGITADVESNCLQEIARWGATELHNIAAYVGGVGAEAVLKALIGQYTPVNSTHLFDAVHGTGVTLTL